ncbi:MAG: deoxyguanosinetriphosphate triphosphohydrolase [Ruminococcus sp.]|jgi:dGTPase
MKWKDLLSPEREGRYGSGKRVSSDLRSEFAKDYHRIIGSASFRRLQDKTQVFPLDKSDFIRTRLTHSLEVSSFAKSLGQNIAQYILQNEREEDFTLQTQGDICDILQCAGLIHDIGNPPFGHFGEEAIRDWFKKNLGKVTCGGVPVPKILSRQMLNDLYHFEGNAQALRLVSRLHFLVNEHGMNLTYALLNTIVKYPVSSTEINGASGDIKDKKMGYFYAEQSLYEDIAKETTALHVRHPLTYILEAADDIAYRTADIEDAFKKGCITYKELYQEIKDIQAEKGEDSAFDMVRMLEHQYENGLQRKVKDPQLYAVQNWVVRLQSALIFAATKGFTSHYSEIMEGSFRHDIFYETEGKWAADALGDIAYRYAFTSRPILKLEVAAATILDFLLDRLVPAAVHYDTEDMTDMMEQKMISLISENYVQTYHIYARGKSRQEKLYLRLLLVTDFLSGMTDSYAKNLYQELNGIA